MKRPKDQEATHAASRKRMQTLGTAIIPAPSTVAPHTHSADQITDVPFGLTAADDLQEALEEHDTEKLARSGVQPMLGNLDMNSFFIYNLGANHFDTTPTDAPVDGGLQWADDAGIERLIMTADGVDMPVGGVYVKAKNATGSTIAAGMAVYLTGAVGAENVLTIDLLDLDTQELNLNVALGVTMQSIADGAKGWVCAHGYAGALDMSAYSDGLQLYVTGTGTMGGGIPEKGCSARIRMGMVIDSSNPGSMWVQVDWRPDLDELANVSIGEYGAKQFYDVPMWLPRQDGEPCNAWRDYPASRLPVTLTPSDYAVDDEQKDAVIRVQATGGDKIITLPELNAVNTFHNNRMIRIKKSSGTFMVDVQTQGGELIEGLYTSVKLKKLGEVLDLQAVGTTGALGWEIQ